MKNKVILCLKSAWLAATVVALVMGTSLCATTEEACFQATNTTFLLMFLLSFPFGLVLVLVSLFFFAPWSIHYPPDYTTLWLIMGFGGFLQWFIVVPRIFRNPDFIVLNLKPDVATVVPTIPTKILPATPAKIVPTTPTKVVQPIARNTHRKRTSRIRAFDTRGRSPLERVIHS